MGIVRKARTIYRRLHANHAVITKGEILIFKLDLLHKIPSNIKINTMKILNGVLLLILSLPFSGITQTYSTGRIANTQYSDFDVPVYTIDVVIDFNADNTGATDASAEIQAALNMADSLYGGIVYLPSGSYLIENPLTIPEQVTLRGD